MYYPSVTTILKPYSDFSRVNPGVLEYAADRGVNVHAACAAYALDLPIDDLYYDEEPYFESFKKWYDSTVKMVVSIEQEYRCDKYRFLGHPDIVCILIDNSKVVVDFKTPVQYKRLWSLQLSAYAHLTNVDRAFALRLSPEGKRAKVNENKNWQRDFNIFLNALAVYHYFNG